MSDFSRQPAQETESQGFDPISIATSVAPALGGPLTGLGALGLQGALGNSGVLDRVGGQAKGIVPDGLGEMLSGAGDWIGEKVGSAKSWAGDKIDSATDWAGNKFDSATDWAGNQIDAAGSWLGEQWNGVTGWAANKASDAKGWWDDYSAGVSKEGWASAFDPTGVVDRQRASKELSGNFEVVPDDFAGEKKSNQVTQAEYDKVVKMYSDIRLGRGDLTLDTTGLSEKDAAAFKDGTMKDIGNILQTASGRKLIERLSDQKDDFTTKIKQAPNALDASESAEDFTNGTNGKGTNTTVQYVPGTDVTIPGAKDNWNPIRSDVVLYHELTHSLYDVEGTTDADTVGKSSGVKADVGSVKNYEHQAVGLGHWKNSDISENTYRSERNGLAGQPGSRAGDKDMKQRTQYNSTF